MSVSMQRFIKAAKVIQTGTVRHYLFLVFALELIWFDISMTKLAGLHHLPHQYLPAVTVGGLTGIVAVSGKVCIITLLMFMV